jgi:hypothetical protein
VVSATLSVIPVAVALCTWLHAAAASPVACPHIIGLIMTDLQFAAAMSCRMWKEILSTPAMDNLAVIF